MKTFNISVTYSELTENGFEDVFTPVEYEQEVRCGSMEKAVRYVISNFNYIKSLTITEL